MLLAKILFLRKLKRMLLTTFVKSANLGTNFVNLILKRKLFWSNWVVRKRIFNYILLLLLLYDLFVTTKHHLSFTLLFCLTLSVSLCQKNHFINQTLKHDNEINRIICQSSKWIFFSFVNIFFLMFVGSERYESGFALETFTMLFFLFLKKDMYFA